VETPQGVYLCCIGDGGSPECVEVVKIVGSDCAAEADCGNCNWIGTDVTANPPGTWILDEDAVNDGFCDGSDQPEFCNCSPPFIGPPDFDGQKATSECQ